MDTYKMLEKCPHDEFCGGCVYQGTAYEEQLKIKENEVLKLLDDKGLSPEVIDPMEPSPTIYRYRNKMEYTFGDLVKDGPLTLGMHKKGNFMSIVTVDHCQLVHEDFNIVLSAVLDFCSGYTKYHKKKHRGLLRNLIIRAGQHTGEMIINIVTTSEPGFDEAGFAAMLQELGGRLEHEIVGIMRTFNDDKGDAVKVDQMKVLRGVDHYHEKIMGLDFKVSAFSFFQTNVLAVENLYSTALNLLDDYENKNVFDLFCGTGTITQTLAGKAGHVTGVELVEEAVDAARKNAELNGLTNCDFIAGDVFQVLSELDEKPDVIVVDPPRAGISEKALDRIISYDVEQIVYISCNTKTLVQNLYYLEYYGYKVKYLKPFDNFPFTKHVECVALMSRVEK